MKTALSAPEAIGIEKKLQANALDIDAVFE
jgi:hypothetical protein